MLPDLSDLDQWLWRAEHAAGGVRAGCHKQVVWAGAAGVKTPVSIVYVHGFSATAGEVRPLPDLVAKALGANLFFTRLTGHGQDGVAMGRARLPDWEADVAQALAIGQQLGDRVIVMGCSTGCTLLTQALARSADGASKVSGSVHISPNFGLRNAAAQILLQMPAVRHWGHLVGGRKRSFDPISDAHAALWTVQYDMQAVYTMADAVRAALAAPIEDIQTPAYFAFCEADQVVHPAKTRRIIARWGGRVTTDLLVQGRTDDAMGHVMAGDVFSPAQTAPLAKRIIRWAKTI